MTQREIVRVGGFNLCLFLDYYIRIHPPKYLPTILRMRQSRDENTSPEETMNE